ncbi:hypothetical protein QQX98_002604 [Neonectria punicea]|uniref:B30.2/SPRY domain-containing protein n=1 Tax=Neonectria punicea TaxID=979145 RepID=A0ABR1HIS1_9HYPO
MLRRGFTTVGLHLAGVLCLATTVAAAEDSEFAFNLFSDIAPILALFGEQFARQYTSESMTWLDHFIFAMVPLGILTTITGAIRVQGPRIARAFIGRARENRALAEIELMSSTSGEVCELFNGNSIVRAMGKAKIEQFLIFPSVYDQLEAEYKEADKRQDKTSEAARPPADRSCGIHTLKSVISMENGTNLMECVPYHSHSYQRVQRLIKELKKRFSGSKSPEDVTMDVEASRSTVKCTSQKSYNWIGPPNLQLNLSSDHFEGSWMRTGHELGLAFLTAVALQTGLITTAVMTVYHQPTRALIGSEPKVYGFPCYIAGSVLLSLGMATCSCAVEKSTIEHAWKLPKPDKRKDGGKWKIPRKARRDTNLQTCPRLVWLQGNQTVNDQAFDSYTILGGPKRYIVTSNRIEDVERWSKESESSRRHDSENSSNEKASVDSQKDLHASRNEKLATSPFWKLLSVAGVVASAIGFIVQFIGLRGLAYPCSIAQLIAIILMALTRGLVRRRLGRIPAHCSALPGYELDFLATYITFCPRFRNFHEVKGEQYMYLQQPSGFMWQWRIDTAAGKSRKDSPFLFRTQKELANPESTKDSVTPPKEHHSHYHPTSQQLLRSVELFMNTFLPPSEERRLDWVIETSMPPLASPPEEQSSITISIRSSGEKWEVDIGTVEAALSLWMASIEATTLQDKKSPTEGSSTNSYSQKKPDWRRAKAGTGMRHSFCRILGDDFEDGVLKRDLSWWVDELVAHTAANTDNGSESPNNTDSESPNSADSDSDGSATTTTWRKNHARESDVDLVIGFNGRSDKIDPRRKFEKGEARELAIVSSASLPTILAQHLFTSFMWTVAEALPKDRLRKSFTSNQPDIEIDGGNKFNPQEFIQTWHWPTLRHRELTKVIRQMEAYGLGTTIDILLCMIPALSFKDLLPNQTMLKLVPQFGHGQGWAETARCYNRLLETSIGTATEENFCYAVVVAVMDFLYFACEPYDEYITPPWELRDELKDIVGQLVSEKFVHAVKKLAPVYTLQHRREAFAYIFKQFKSGEGTDSCLKVFETMNINVDMEFGKHTLGFSELHQRVHAATKEDKYHLFRTFKIKGKEAVTRDIFGWTPFHYACFAAPYPVLTHLFDAVEDVGDLRVHKIFDTFRRSPVHIAASSGMEGALKTIVRLLNNEDQKNAMNMCGLDGMTPLHLATKIGSKECVDYIIETAKTLSVTEVDVWGREAIHIAASGGHANIAIRLLKAGSRSDALDEIGKSPIDYVLKDDWGLKNDQNPTLGQGAGNDQTSRSEQHSDNDAPTKENEGSADGEKTKKREEDAIRTESKRRIFLELALKKPDYHDGDGRTFLHRAAQATDYDTISKLLYEKHHVNARDLEGRTPLHCAILAGRAKIALSLIDGINGTKANTLLKDKMGTTTLMFSTQCSLVPVITRVLEDNIHATKDTDENGWTALHHAVETTNYEMVNLMVEKGCDPATKNSAGRTPLHMALDNEHEDIAMYLLEKASLQDDPKDNDGESLLIPACGSGYVGAIRGILEKWPEIINDPDPEYDETPLCWACENGEEEAVKMLLKYEELDLNKAATKWRNYTPVHFAISARNKDILTWLVEKDSLDTNAKNKDDETALQMAVDRQLPDYAAVLLLHKATLDDVRIEHLKLFSLASYAGFQAIIPELLTSVKAESFSDDDLVELFETSIRGGARQSWPRSARVGSLRVIQLLTKQGANPAELDEDNWSCVDYAARYGHKEILDELSELVRQHSEQRLTRPLHVVPTSLEIGDFKDSIVGGPCGTSSHRGCKFNDIQVQTAHTPDIERICLRSKNCIPPPTASTKHFYFEVTVLKNSNSRILGLGFCDDQAPTIGMPGWFTGSWGYHGDDGYFFIESGQGFAPTGDFGPSAAYAAGDVAGVGMNLETGEGFCTLNGKRRDVGPAFEGGKFKFGKWYPCVGVDAEEEGVGLHFVVNFDGSDRHPFKYAGPFV